jgi:hypothetical protein
LGGASTESITRAEIMKIIFFISILLDGTLGVPGAEGLARRARLPAACA